MSETTRVGRPRATPTTSTGSARDEILDAAAALFAEHGYAGTSTRAIAERVGIRQASLYYHFAGKDEILLELLETSVRPSLDFVERLRDIPDPAAALAALAAVDVRTLLATPHNIGALYLAPEVQEARFDGFRRDRALLQQAYVDLVAAIAPDADAAFLGACCMQLVEMVIPMRRAGEPLPGLAASIAAACLRVVGAPAPPVPSGQEGRSSPDQNSRIARLNASGRSSAS
jgi:AcrR family transcriptional regulator